MLYTCVGVYVCEPQDVANHLAQRSHAYACIKLRKLILRLCSHRKSFCYLRDSTLNEKIDVNFHFIVWVCCVCVCNESLYSLSVKR